MPEDVYLSDLENLPTLEALEKAYREYKAIDSEMKLAKARRDYARTRMETELESSGRTDDGSAGIKVKLTKKLAPKITDHDALLAHVYELPEPASTYLEERFIRPNQKAGISDPLEILINKAVEVSLATGKTLAECMPPGLTVFPYSRLTVTLRAGDEPESEAVSETAKLSGSRSKDRRGRFAELDRALGGDNSGLKT